MCLRQIKKDLAEIKETLDSQKQLKDAKDQQDKPDGQPFQLKKTAAEMQKEIERLMNQSQALTIDPLTEEEIKEMEVRYEKLVQFKDVTAKEMA